MNLFRKTTEQRNHSTRSALKNFVFVEEANSQLHGIESIRYQAVVIWSKLQNNIHSNLIFRKILLNVDEPAKKK